MRWEKWILERLFIILAEGERAPDRAVGVRLGVDVHVVGGGLEREGLFGSDLDGALEAHIERHEWSTFLSRGARRVVRRHDGSG